jgi:high-affinity iron transporter
MIQVMKKLILLMLFFSSCSLFAQENTDYKTIVAQMNTKASEIITNYTPEKGLDASDEFSDIYFDIFEGSGMEQAVAMKNANLKTKLESMFATVIGLSTKGEKKEAIQKSWSKLHKELQKTTPLLKKEKSSFIGAFVQSFLIMLREGFEAMLVIMALISYLIRAKAKDKLYVIYYGVGIALLLSVATAYLLSVVFKLSVQSQELLEGITMLIAAGILFYVSFWLLAKAQADKWQTYIKDKVQAAITGGNLFALGFASFLAVYREGAETVLFYQALSVQVGEQVPALILGFVVATVSLIVIYIFMKHLAVKLPLQLFFKVTAVLLFYLAFSFTGTGILELQEARVASITPIDWMPTISWLGIYPTVETLGAQLIILLPLPFVWFFLQKKPASIKNEK